MHLLKAIFFGLIEGCLRNISGPLGRKLRYLYYKNRFASCGENVYIDEGVVIEGPECMHIGHNVWIDKYVILIAGKKTFGKREHFKYLNRTSEDMEGKLIIGSNVHIGIQTIIQAHGGVQIDDDFTSSAGCKMYSLSNDEKKSTSGVMAAAHYVISPIKINKNVWLGLNSIILGGEIGDDVFVAPNSVVIKSLESNTFASGNPAKKVKNRFDFEGVE